MLLAMAVRAIINEDKSSIFDFSLFFDAIFLFLYDIFGYVNDIFFF